MAIRFNENICTELCDLRQEGLSQEDCADIVGINRSTLYRWIQKGEKAKSGKYREFYINWRKSTAKYKQFHIGEINKSKFWQAHQYMLQVADPDTYVVAEKQQVESKAEVDLKAEANVDIETIFDKVDKELGLNDD